MTPLGSTAVDVHPDSERPSPAKQYNRIKLLTGVTASVLSFLLLLVLVVTGWSVRLRDAAYAVAANDYAALVVFVSAVAAVRGVLMLPLAYYSGFVIEHRYHLSNQSLARWAWERTKGMLVGLPIGVAALMVLYYCLTAVGAWWWLPVGAAVTLLSVVLARLAPIIIMPLFYRFTQLEEGPLRSTVERLCSQAGLRIDGVFTFNLSKNTRKANAGFTGIGKAKRVILGDTLVKEFEEDEIETVFAHELGHYAHKHIVAGIAVGTLSTFVGLGVAAWLYEWSAEVMGFAGTADIAALPLLAVWLSLYGLAISPLMNGLSRHHECQADAYAVRMTGKAAAFVSALRKLARMNLADPEPHPLVEFMFHSHPPIAKRIAMVEALGR